MPEEGGSLNDMSLPAMFLGYSLQFYNIGVYDFIQKYIQHIPTFHGSLMLDASTNIMKSYDLEMMISVSGLR